MTEPSDPHVIDIDSDDSKIVPSEGDMTGVSHLLWTCSPIVADFVVPPKE
jgi:hypothetical protein